MTADIKSGLTPIGYMHSCFPEKFGTPRQPGLVTAASGTIALVPPYNVPEMVRGLEAYSHIWVIFQFHGCADRPWRPTVRPPRLGGNRRMGVLATRSTFRPNAIGMSAVRLAGIRCNAEGVFIAVTGIDIIDGTPVLDIKPYLPYSDCIAEAAAPQAPAPPGEIPVTFSPPAAAALAALETTGYPGLGSLLSTVLALDPRPAYHAGRHRKKTYAMRIYDLNVRWEPAGEGIRVTSITGPAPDQRSRLKA
ncbi:MAG: tRNA (N6-threonylcarbamoyladenosine(37)-N6)-methyltransferase TrmO [Pseudomonadota bacterium]